MRHLLKVGRFAKRESLKVLPITVFFLVGNAGR